MSDRLLLFGLVSVAMGMCAGGVMVAWYAVRGTAALWRAARPSPACPGCRSLGRRCPWCAEVFWRGAVTVLAVPLPEVAWLVMTRGSIAFPPRVQVATMAWIPFHLGLVLSCLLRL